MLCNFMLLFYFLFFFIQMVLFYIYLIFSPLFLFRFLSRCLSCMINSCICISSSLFYIRVKSPAFPPLLARVILACILWQSKYSSPFVSILPLWPCCGPSPSRNINVIFLTLSSLFLPFSLLFPLLSSTILALSYPNEVPLRDTNCCAACDSLLST